MLNLQTVLVLVQTHRDGCMSDPDAAPRPLETNMIIIDNETSFKLKTLLCNTRYQILCLGKSAAV